MDTSPLPPDLTLDRLTLVGALAWMIWKRLESVVESQRDQGRRIGALEASRRKDDDA